MDNRLPALRDPEMTPQRVVTMLPQISGEHYQHVGRYAGAVVLACYEQMGGLQRFVNWADDNPTDFYTKMFAKTIQRSTQVDTNLHLSIDDAISGLENRPIVEAEYTDIEDGEFTYDL